MTTLEEEKEIIRVCGSNYEPNDVPAYIRQREFKEEMSLLDVLDRQAEEIEAEN